MKQEDKQLLLKDLCARLPYGVKVQTPLINDTITLTCGDISAYFFNFDNKVVIKPYLRPMSSMTEEEKKELLQISNFDPDIDEICVDSIYCIERGFIDIADIANFINWLYSHHFDCCGLLSKGLAIEVTEENNPYK